MARIKQVPLVADYTAVTRKGKDYLIAEEQLMVAMSKAVYALVAAHNEKQPQKKKVKNGNS